MLGFEPRPPKVHVGTVRYGAEPTALVVDRWWYQAKQLYGAYDTNQIFQDDGEVQGVCSMLNPWQVKGRYLPAKPVPWFEQVRERLRAVTLEGEPIRRLPKPAPKARLPVVALLEKLPPDERVRHVRRLLPLLQAQGV